MSGEGEGNNSNEQQSSSHPDLNFSLNDILSNNHHDVNDSSFQSIVQTLSTNNNTNETPSYAHLPAELQDLFSNESDDLLPQASSHNGDASSLMHVWNQQQQQPTFVVNQQQQSANNIKPAPIAATPPPIQHTPQHTPTIQQQRAPTPVLQHPAPPPQQQQQQPAASSTTLLDNITSQLPIDQKDRFIQLFRGLQSSQVSAPDFLSQAKSLLGQQQYQQLEDLKRAKPSLRPALDIRQEDAQRSLTPQLKRAKIESQQQQPFPIHFQPQTQQQLQQHLQMQMQQQQMMQQQPQQHVFKAPAMPIVATPGLQVPKLTTPVVATPTVMTPTAMPTKQLQSTTANGPTAAQPTSSSGGGGDNRIDYDQLTDVMGYAGVDLKEEAEHFMTHDQGGILPDGIDRSKMQDFMNTDMLRDRILKHAKGVDIKQIDADFVSYLALAVQDRVRTVMESMVLASKHRTLNPFYDPPQPPRFKIQVKQNVKSQLNAIEKVARQIELDLDPESDDEGDVDMDHKKGWYSKKSKMPLVKADTGPRKVTVQDAIFVMERDVQGGRGSNQKTLLRAYNEWLS